MCPSAVAPPCGPRTAPSDPSTRESPRRARPPRGSRSSAPAAQSSSGPRRTRARGTAPRPAWATDTSRLPTHPPHRSPGCSLHAPPRPQHPIHEDGPPSVGPGTAPPTSRGRPSADLPPAQPGARPSSRWMGACFARSGSPGGTAPTPRAVPPPCPAPRRARHAAPALRGPAAPWRDTPQTGQPLPGAAASQSCESETSIAVPRQLAVARHRHPPAQHLRKTRAQPRAQSPQLDAELRPLPASAAGTAPLLPPRSPDPP
mmetsp:Transcript_25217/g.65471  ORF Transcript_25217/g.65471 Transcript_25217/m.65471 type:complete len:259 (+) Transcript_25217:746-1522(+)